MIFACIIVTVKAISTFNTSCIPVRSLCWSSEARLLYVRFTKYESPRAMWSLTYLFTEINVVWVSLTDPRYFWPFLTPPRIRLFHRGSNLLRRLYMTRVRKLWMSNGPNLFPSSHIASVILQSVRTALIKSVISSWQTRWGGSIIGHKIVTMT